MRNEHAWKTRTEDGRKREVRARLFGRRWTFRARISGEELWTEYDEPLLEDLLALREMLFDKYQRKHLAHEHLASVEALIRDRGATWEE